MPPKPVLAIGLLLIGIMASAAAQTPPPEPEITHFASEIESIELPEHRKWYTVLVTADGKPSAIADWFSEDARLSDLKSRTEWRHYYSTSPMFAAHLKPAYGSDYPLLVIQDQDGAMRAQLGGTQLRLIENPDQLVAALNLAADTLRPLDQRKMGGWLFNRRPTPSPNVCPGPNCPLPPAPEPPPEKPPVTQTPVEPQRRRTRPLRTGRSGFSVHKSLHGRTDLTWGNLLWRLPLWGVPFSGSDAGIAVRDSLKFSVFSFQLRG